MCRGSLRHIRSGKSSLGTGDPEEVLVTLVRTPDTVSPMATEVAVGDRVAVIVALTLPHNHV